MFNFKPEGANYLVGPFCQLQAAGPSFQLYIVHCTLFLFHHEPLSPLLTQDVTAFFDSALWIWKMSLLLPELDMTRS